MERLRRVVHIGGGSLAPLAVPFTRRPSEIHYIIDPDARLAERFRDWQRLYGKHLVFRTGSAERTGLRQSSVHVVHLHNVISDLSIERGTRAALLAEAARIVRRDGSIYVAETWTPRDFSSRKLERWAKRNGFHVEFIVKNAKATLTQKEVSILQLHLGYVPLFIPGGYVARLTRSPAMV